MEELFMTEQKILYSMFYKAQDRFQDPHLRTGFEPDVIQDYIQCGMTLASFHERHAEHENIILCELYLRQVFFHLIEAIESPTRSIVFRNVCLNSIHSPLFHLKRHYFQQADGREHFFTLQNTLQKVQAPLG